MSSDGRDVCIIVVIAAGIRAENETCKISDMGHKALIIIDL
jgi:hypothetical protein